MEGVTTTRVYWNFEMNLEEFMTSYEAAIECQEDISVLKANVH